MYILNKIRQVINPKVVYLVVCHRCYIIYIYIFVSQGVGGSKGLTGV